MQWYHPGPSTVTPNKDSDPPIWGTVYSSKVNGARKVKFNAQVAMNKNSDLIAEIVFLGVDGENSAPNSNFSKRLE